MAESRKHILNKKLELDKMLREAEHRWLRTPEIRKILGNYQKFELRLTPVPPFRPQAGSLFFFDRRTVRNFRQDGHQWRKKKDGKTVSEAHEKLKLGGVDDVNCYYARREDNKNFQRRSYWLLDKKLKHIVLVHYREVNEGYSASISSLLVGPVPLAGSPQSSPAQVIPPLPLAQISYASSASRVDWHGKALPCESDNVDSASSHAQPLSSSLPQIGPFFEHETTGFFSDRNLHFERSKGSLIVHKLEDARLEADSMNQNAVTCRNRLINDMHIQSVIGVSESINEVQKEHDLNAYCNGESEHFESGELKRIDSFGEWMDKEFGGDCDDSLMAFDYGNYWNTLDVYNGNKEVSSLHILLDEDLLGPSLSQEQLFSIHEFSSDWAYPSL